MKTSLDEIKQTEEFHFGSMKPSDRIVFEARLLLSPVLRWNTECQKKIYGLVRLYGKKKMREELEEIHHRLFADPDKSELRRTIENYFN